MPVASEATQHIFGHTIFDDITGNGMRSEDLFQYYALYASADDPDKLAVSCKVGGEIVAQDSTRFYNYKVAEIVSFISQFQTLQPGDVISCGTAFKPSADRKSIHHANLGLGTQENPVIRKQMDIGQWRL